MGNSGSTTTKSPSRKSSSYRGQNAADRRQGATKSLNGTLSRPLKGTIQVVVEHYDVKYHLNIQPTTQIRHVKVILLAEYGVDMDQQHLFFNGISTEDEKTLRDYNFKSGNSLQVSPCEKDVESSVGRIGRLIDAASKGDLDAVKDILSLVDDDDDNDDDDDVVNASEWNTHNTGRRALHAAAEEGHVETARFLIHSGADVDAADNNGLTPLHLAASKGHENVFRLLLKEGAELNRKAQGKKIIHFAATGGSVPLLELLGGVVSIKELTEDQQTSTLHLAAKCGHLQAVLWMVEKGINFNLRDKRGRTAEDYARDGGHKGIATYLYHWALLQQKKFLQVAAQGNLVSVLSFFKIGVDIECKTQDEGEWGHRAIHTASLHGHTEVVNALLYVGARREAEDDMGNTAMHYAAAGGQIGTLKLLMNEECNVCACNNHNMTPLHFAAMGGELATVIWLLAQGVQADIKSTTGLSAADMAESEKHYALVDVLRKHQAKQLRRPVSADVVKIEQMIGQGSFGKVFLATMNKRMIVVKKIKFTGAHSREIEFAARELLLLKHLKHPNIVTYMGNSIQDQHLHIIMEYCSGGDLAQRINQQQAKDTPFEEKLVFNWTNKIASALKYLHRRKVLHRDLKPHNIFLSSSGAIKLGDFGLARVMGDTMFVQTFVGAPAYMSPEILNNTPYDDKADMWSFGCILYELAALKRGFPYSNVIVPGTFSQEYKRLVVLLLNQNPRNRPSSSEVLQLPFLQTDQSKYEDQQQHQQQLKELNRELERPLNELMTRLLSL